MEAELASLVNRLEAVTTRLEAAEARVGSGLDGGAAAAPRANGVAPPPAPVPAPARSLPAENAIAAYDALVATQLGAFMDAAGALGGEYAELSGAADDAFRGERTIVAAMLECKKPAPPELQQLVAPVGELMVAASARTEGPRGPAFHHAKCLAEALQCLSWVVYTPESGLNVPPKHIAECWQSAEFWANKVLMQHKSSDPRHGAWVTALKELVKALEDFAASFFPSGPTWSAAGIPVAQYLKAGGAPSPARAPAPAPPKAAPRAGPPRPPPPPPGPPPKPDMTPGRGGGGGGGGAQDVRSALLSQLAKGEGVTAGLRKVTDDMKTKNRADRPSVVPGAPAAKPKPAAGKAGPVPRGPPRFELEQGRKWVIEHQVDNRELVVEGSMLQTVYVYGCRDCVVQIKGKMNAVTLDNCDKVGLVFETLVSTCEAVNSRGVEVQCTGTVPTIAIDKVDSCTVYLAPSALGVQITTAKSSSVNVIVPGADEAVDEHYVPEQFISRIVGGKLVTEAMVHSGA